MIGLLEGVLLSKTPQQVLVNVGGVGYRVLIPLSTFYALPEPPAKVALQIHTRLQDDGLQLYGFHEEREKELFLELLGIPRIGPKMALNILSGINPEEFRQALDQQDAKRLAAIPGLGKKSAERIIVELKDRLPRKSRAWTSAAGRGDQPWQDALSALLNLGYPRALAEKGLEAARRQGAARLEDLLRQSLKYLAK